MRYIASGAMTIIALVSFNIAYAHHIKGGWIGYKYTGAGNAANTSKYEITVYLYVSCTETGPTDQVILGVFDGQTNGSVLFKTIAKTTSYNMTKKSFSPCMTNPPSICYNVYTYTTTIDLSNNANGYTLAVQDALRIDNIVNISNSGSAGITFTAIIPGTVNGVDYSHNSSPYFAFLDTAIVCHNGNISVPFSATDPDGMDSLSYSFGNGLNVTGANQNVSSRNPAAPPYPSLTYISGYSGAYPMGVNVTIDPITGLITGKAPSATGEYDVTVYVKEWRNGVLIDSVKKELQIQVANCDLSAATLNLSYINCQDYTFTFQNQSSTSISHYEWYFDTENHPADYVADATPTYTYPDTGTYQLKLIVSNQTGCTDSAKSTIKVYPGFAPDFTSTGTCFQNPIIFTDQSYAKYGHIDSWNWNFGDPASNANTSVLQNPTHAYSGVMNTTATLTITSSKGCQGAVSHEVTVNGKPQLILPFTDTLICSNDPPLPLKVISEETSSYQWTPSYRISDANTANPLVTPLDTTLYKVIVTDNGCVDSGYVRVNVLDYIDVALKDTIGCIGDSIVLYPISHALSYQWTQISGTDELDKNNVKSPAFKATGDNSYHVDANLGHCQADANITIKTANYPVVTATGDTTICTGGTAWIGATTDAATYQWQPGNIADLSTSVHPGATTNYIITVRNPDSYCPKPVSDTVHVNVIEPIVVDAGHDTVVVVGQPLQLHVTVNNPDANHYAWTPAAMLDNASVADPYIGVPAGITSVTYAVSATTDIGCTGSDAVTVKIFQTGPDIFVPSGFTPNSDGVNDKLIPVCVGVKKFDYFKIYNRWGDLVYASQKEGDGWDGNYKGTSQSAGTTFVYMAQGWDYNGNKIFKKGTVALIR